MGLKVKHDHHYSNTSDQKHPVEDDIKINCEANTSIGKENEFKHLKYRKMKNDKS